MTKSPQSIRTVVSVLGKDRPGIVARVANTIADAGANIDDIKQSLLDDVFAMTMLVTLNEGVAGFNELQEALTRDGEELGVQIRIQREDIFNLMYKI